jgi:protein TonB
MTTERYGLRFAASLAAATLVTVTLFALMVGLLPNAWQAPQEGSTGAINFTRVTPVPPPVRQPIRRPEPVKVRKPPARPEFELSELELSTDSALRTTPRMDRSLALELMSRPRLPDIPDLGNEFTFGEGLVPKALMPPMYPPRGLTKGVEGVVVVRFTVNPKGDVVKAEIVNAQPENMFENATLRAVRRWKFQPVLVDGQPATVTAMQTIGFNLVNDVTAHVDGDSF